MSYKSHSLNVWAVEDGASKLDIDAHSDRIDFTTTNDQPLKIHPTLHLVHSGGDITDVAQKLKVIEADITSNAGIATNGITVVQNDLDSYKSVNNSSVGTLQAGLATETAQRIQGQADDASARASDKSTLETLITTEETRATTAEGVLTSSVSAETSRAQGVEASLTASIASVSSSLTSAINVEKGRIDDLVSNASVDLDTLKEITDAYANVDSNTLNQIADMTLTINTLVQRVNALTSSTDSDFVVALNTAIAELDLVNGKAFLTQPFSLNFDMRDMYSSATSAMLGWATYKAVIIASSSGVLTGTSTDSDVETYIKSVLDATFGLSVLANSTLADYRLKYSDYGHYLLETGLSGAKPYFKGVEQTALPDCAWRISYCSVSGDDSSIYSTILSGTQSGKVLTISPRADGSEYGIEFPVNGIANVRDGYKTTYTQFTLK